MLKLIKSMNAGVQVILLTASEKSSILDEANQYNILGYIKKESPNDESNYTKDVFKKLTKMIDAGFERKYLKDIWNIQQEISRLDIFRTDNYNEIKKEVEFIFGLLDSTIEKRFPIAMLTIYKVLEIIKDLYIDDKSGKYLHNQEEIKAICLKDKTYIAVEKNDLLNKPEEYEFNNTTNKTAKQNAQDYYYSTANKISAILYEKLNFTQEKKLYDKVVTISKKRNRYIHPYIGQKIKVDKDDILKKIKVDKDDILKKIKVDKDDILKWFEMLQMILSKLK